jgi:myosin protein heavy chain
MGEQVQKEFGEGRPARNIHFKKNKVRPECFSVSHFAGEVEYSVTGFVDKNRDSLSSTSREVLELSSLPLLAELFTPL